MAFLLPLAPLPLETEDARLEVSRDSDALPDTALQDTTRVLRYYIWPKDHAAAGEKAKCLQKAIEGLAERHGNIEYSDYEGKVIHWVAPMTAEQAEVLRQHTGVSLISACPKCIPADTPRWLSSTMREKGPTTTFGHHKWAVPRKTQS